MQLALLVFILVAERQGLLIDIWTFRMAKDNICHSCNKIGAENAVARIPVQ